MIVIIFKPINLYMRLGAQKNRLIEAIDLSTRKIPFGWELKKIVFQYTLLFGGLITGSVRTMN